MLESSINEQLGNLYRKGVYRASGNPYESSLLSLMSFEKGDLAVWLQGASLAQSMHGNDVAIDAESGDRIDQECSAAISGIGNISKPAKTKAGAEAKRSRKTKKEIESLVTVKSCAAEQSIRVTRSRKLSAHDTATFVEGVKKVTNSYCNGRQETKAMTVSNRITCQKCLPSEVNSGSLTHLIQMKWEIARRRQVLRLLIGLGIFQYQIHVDFRSHIMIQFASLTLI